MSAIATLFLRMGECYGSRWTAQYQDDEDMAVRVLKTWSRTLAELTDQQVNSAAQAMIERYPSFPPTLGEFLALGREFENFAPPRYVPPEPKPRSAESMAMASQMLADLKRTLAEGLEGAGE